MLMASGVLNAKSLKYAYVTTLGSSYDASAAWKPCYGLHEIISFTSF